MYKLMTKPMYTQNNKTVVVARELSWYSIDIVAPYDTHFEGACQKEKICDK